MGMSSSRENIQRTVISDENLVSRQRQVSVTKCNINSSSSGKLMTEKTSNEKNKFKNERSWFAYCIFYLLGCGTLLPWNFFITANDYFKFKLVNNAKLSNQFQNYFSIASMGPNLIVMILNVAFLHRFSRFVRICSALVTMAIMFGATTVLVFIDFTETPETFFAITLCKMVVINASGAILQGALFGMVVLFPGRYVQAVMAGQGLGGVFAVVASLASLLGQSDIQMSALGYFSTATIVLIVSLVAYIMLEQSAFVKSYSQSVEKVDLLLDDFSNHELNGKEKNFQKSNIFTVFRQILPMAASSFTVFLVTLAVFPSTTARIVSVSNAENQWTKKYFVPVTCFLIFNLGDYGGKMLTGFIEKPKQNGYWLLVLCIARLAFVPLFVFCNVQPRLNGSSVYFNSDAVYIVLMILFSVSNGYLASLSVMYAPRLVKSEDAELAGTMMAFCIVAGLAAGAGASFIIAPNI